MIPGVVLATYAVNVALPSAAGTAAAAGAIFVPLMMSAGIHPAMAGAAVKCGTYGSMLNPGLAHNPFVAKIAGVGVMDVIAFHFKANIASLLTAAVLITLIAYYRKEHKGYIAEGLEAEASFKVNWLYAIMPILPIVILILGTAGVVPALKMDVPQAMVIGAMLALVVTRKNPTNFSNAFFDGMGKAYGSILGIIISAGVFVSGMTAMGLVKTFTTAMLNNPGIVKVCAAVGPFILGMQQRLPLTKRLRRMPRSLACLRCKWAAWRPWEAPWGVLCRLSPVQPSSLPVLPALIPWKLPNVIFCRW